MRIVISGRAALYPESDLLPSDPDAVPVTDPKILRTFDGYDAEPDDDLSDDLGASLLEAGVRGGTLQFTHDKKHKDLRVITEYTCKRLLTKDELAMLIEETIGAWSDGVGENGCEVEWDGGTGIVYPISESAGLSGRGRGPRRSRRATAGVNWNRRP